MRVSGLGQCIAVLGFAAAVGAGGAEGAWASPSPLRAPSERQASAQTDFNAAHMLFDRGKYGEALELFRRAYEASGSPNAHLMVARCLGALDKKPEAYEAMAATLKEATVEAESVARYARTRDAAAAELALLDRRVGKVIVVLVEPPAKGAAVSLNGRALPFERLGVPVAVEPGTGVVVAEQPGAPPVQQSIDVGAGETKTVVITYPKSDPINLVNVSLSTSKRESEPKAVARRGSGGHAVARMAGFTMGGVGIAGMVVFGVAAAAADSKFSSIERECGGARCADPVYGPVTDHGRTLDAVANAGLVVGIVGLVGGSALIALGGSSSGPKAAVTAGLSSNGAGLGIKGTF